MSYGQGPCNGYGYGQPHSTTNYHRTHSSEHVTKVAQRSCPAGGAVLQHHVVHKESFKEVDAGKQAPANRRCFENYSMKANSNAMAANHHGGGSHRRYESYEETYEESREETYAYGAGRHHGHGAGGRRRYEYKTHEENSSEEEDDDDDDDKEEEEQQHQQQKVVVEVVMGGGGCGQLRRGYRGA